MAEDWTVVGVQVASKTKRMLFAASRGGNGGGKHVLRAGAN